MPYHRGRCPLIGKFAMKPFLAQGAVIASEGLGDYQWVKPIWRHAQGHRLPRADAV